MDAPHPMPRPVPVATAALAYRPAHWGRHSANGNRGSASTTPAPHRGEAGSGAAFSFPEAIRASMASTRTRAWLRKALAEVRVLRRLPSDWDTYGAEPPSALAAHNAEDVLWLACGLDLRPDRVAPSSEGGVALTFLGEGRRYGHVECLDSGEIVALVSDGRDRVDVWDATHSLAQSLGKIRDNLR